MLDGDRRSGANKQERGCENAGPGVHRDPQF
jgi:hypothetical protein